MSPDEYEPYDWASDEARRRMRSEQHWYRQPDNQPLLAGQFWALWDMHMSDYRELLERVERNERRLVEERGKDLVHDIWSAFWGKVFVIMLAIVSAYVLTNYVHGLHLPS